MEAKHILNNTTYGPRESRQGKDVAGYVQSIMRAAKSVKIKETFLQLEYA